MRLIPEMLVNRTTAAPEKGALFLGAWLHASHRGAESPDLLQMQPEKEVDDAR